MADGMSWTRVEAVYGKSFDNATDLNSYEEGKRGPTFGRRGEGKGQVGEMLTSQLSEPPVATFGSGR